MHFNIQLSVNFRDISMLYAMIATAFSYWKIGGTYNAIKKYKSWERTVSNITSVSIASQFKK